MAMKRNWSIFAGLIAVALRLRSRDLTLSFDFVSIGNLKTPNDVHKHHAEFTLIDNEYMKQAWIFRKDQKGAGSEAVLYTGVQ
jgi:hypothetical protein